jgi:uridine kinase
MSPAERIAVHLVSIPGQPVVRVAVDGVDGVGKTTFADLLGALLAARGRSVVRASVDGFHNPRAVRYRTGRTPEGFYRDSYDYAALRHHLLDPLSPGGSRRYRSAVFDHVTDSAAVADEQVAPEGSVLILDGLFLHRPELAACWDFSILLDAPFEVTVPRGAARGPGFGDPDPAAPSNVRYIEGNRLYFREARPHELATIVLDYGDLKQPRIVTWRA